MLRQLFNDYRIKSSLNRFGGTPGLDKPPVNFILLGHQRCGSNLLVRALAEHPQISMHGEVLAPADYTREAACNAEPRCEVYMQGQDGAEYLEQTIFGPTPVENVWAYGFKIFYDHARFDEYSKTAWDYLDSHDVRVIHLVRRNLLYALVSLETAERTERWLHLIEDERQKVTPLPPFRLEPAVCLEYFERITECRAAARRFFAKHEVLTVEYERDLCANYRETTFRIFTFLGTVPWCSRPGLLKQQKLTAAQQIINFEELRSHFRNTPYEEFFRDTESPDALRAATIAQEQSGALEPRLSKRPRPRNSISIANYTSESGTEAARKYDHLGGHCAQLLANREQTDYVACVLSDIAARYRTGDRTIAIEPSNPVPLDALQQIRAYYAAIWEVGKLLQSNGLIPSMRFDDGEFKVFLDCIDGAIRPGQAGEIYRQTRRFAREALQLAGTLSGSEYYRVFQSYHGLGDPATIPPQGNWAPRD